MNSGFIKYALVLVLLLSQVVNGQYKSFKLTRNGDTLNCIDKNDLRQGKWVVKVEGVRGEPGYDEEGIFIDDKKDGFWRVYTTMGDLFAVERYRWGNRDGVSQYFNIAGLVREESWKAVNPANPYDTIEVPDPLDPAKVEMKVVKIEGSSVKHGNWKYYETGSGRILRTEAFFLDKLQDPYNSLVQNGFNSAGADSSALKAPLGPKAKPQAVLDFEKKNKGKKKVKVLDGSTYQ